MKKDFSVALLTYFLFFLLTSLAPEALGAEKDNRAAHPLGFLITAHGDPAPSALGANLAWNLGGLGRLEAGAGGYHQWMNPGNWAIGAYNWGIRPIITGIWWFFTQGFVKGNERRKRYYNKVFKKLAIDYLPHKSVVTFGGGFNLMVPGWNFTPTAGIHWSHYNSGNSPWGIGNGPQEALYYSAGLDWTTKEGFNLGLGANICRDKLKYACGAYLNLGGFF